MDKWTNRERERNFLTRSCNHAHLFQNVGTTIARWSEKEKTVYTVISQSSLQRYQFQMNIGGTVLQLLIKRLAHPGQVSFNIRTSAIQLLIHNGYFQSKDIYVIQYKSFLHINIKKMIYLFLPVITIKIYVRKYFMNY